MLRTFRRPEPAAVDEDQFPAPAALPRGNQKQKPSFGRLFAGFITGGLIVVVANTFIIRPFVIPSESMAHTLEVGDRIMVNQLDAPGRGDVVVFSDPGGWLPAELAGSQLVKRVIGVAGDRISCCDAGGRLTVNGVALDEPYAFIPPASTAVSEKPFDVVVPKGHVFVMGDNRNNSADSRFHLDNGANGAVPVEAVFGTAMVIYWPMEHLTVLDNYRTVFGRVAAGL